jgi:hypothetical protein
MGARERRGLASWGLALVVLATVSAFAAEREGVELEDRLQRLETQMEAVLQENIELRRKLGLEPSSGTPAGVVQSVARAIELRIGGYLQVHGGFGDPGDARWSGAAGNDRLYLRRTRIEATGRFLEDFNFRVQGDFNNAVGAVSNQRFQLTDGWINWNRWDFANLKTGQFFPVYGYERRSNPLDALAVEVSLPAARLTPQRQLGAQLYGEVLDRRLGYAVAAFNGNDSNHNFNDNDHFMTVGRIHGAPFAGRLLGREARWNLGLSGYHSRDDAARPGPDFVLPGTNIFGGTRLGLAVDTQLRIGPFDLWAEYLQLNLEPDAPAGLSSDNDFRAQGWYVQGGYYFLPKWQALVRYEEYDPTDQVPDNTTRTWTFGLNYWIRGSSLRAGINYLLMEVPGVDGLQNKILVLMQAAF